MTIGELYSMAGPVTATLLMFFTPIGVVAALNLVLDWMEDGK